MKSDARKWGDAWEFFFDSISFLEESKYKSVSKYLISSWEDEMKMTIKCVLRI